MAQTGPKTAPKWPEMAPRWPQDGPGVTLNTLKNQWEIYIFAAGVHINPDMAQVDAKLAPNWPQDGPT